MKPIKNFQKLCDVLSVFNLNGEPCKIQMYDTTMFWIEPIRKDYKNARINLVSFKPDWENETIMMRVMSSPTATAPTPDVSYPIPPSVTESPEHFLSWISDIVFSHQNIIYR